MPQLIIQYLLIVALVAGVTYIVYILKEKGVIRGNDYYGITYTILAMLEESEATPENVKKILRVSSSVVQYVEANYMNESNDIKEQKALVMVKETLVTLNIGSTLSDKSIQYIIRLACAILPAAKG